MHLLLHIGPPKTGTTAIQAALAQNRAALADAGVMQFAPPEPFQPLRALGALHADARQVAIPEYRRKFASPDQVRAWSRDNWQALAAQVAASDADLCAISSEHLSYGLDFAALIADFRRIFDRVTVLAYARDPAALYFSDLQQRLRGLGVRAAELPVPGQYAYSHRKVLERFLPLVGRDNMLVRNFSRANLAGGDAVADFAARLEAFGKRVEMAPVRTNESLPGAALALLLLLNESHDGRNSLLVENRRNMMRALRTSPAVAALPAFRPDMAGARRLIRARAAEDCDWINRNFLQGQELLPVEEDPVETEAKTPARWRAELRDMLLEYLTPGALAVLGREALPT